MNGMTLIILLPAEVFATYDHIAHLAVETSAGALGILPRRRDCVASLVPGILSYRRRDGNGRHIAIDRGIMVKTGPAVTISVRRAFAGAELGDLETLIRDHYLNQDEEDRRLRTLLAKMESGLLRRLADYHHG